MSPIIDGLALSPANREKMLILLSRVYVATIAPSKRRSCSADQAYVTRSNGRPAMHDHVYKVIDLVGSSEKSIEDAINNAVMRAAETVRNLRWFEVAQVRGQIENGKVHYYQAVLKVGFTMEDAGD